MANRFIPKMWIKIATDRWYNRTTGEARSINPFLSHRTHSSNLNATITIHYQQQQNDPFNIDSNIIIHLEFDVTRTALESSFTRSQCRSSLSTTELNALQKSNEESDEESDAKMLLFLQTMSNKVTLTTSTSDPRKQEITLSKTTHQTKRWSLHIAPPKQTNAQRDRTTSEFQLQRDRAVLILQCSFRVVIAHHKMDWKRQKHLMAMNLSNQREYLHVIEQAAITIQRYSRGYVVRDYIDAFVLQEHAAITIQKYSRGNVQRKRTRMAMVTSGILTIQCAIRVWRARTSAAWKEQLQTTRAKIMLENQNERDRCGSSSSSREKEDWNLEMLPLPLPSYEMLRHSIGMDYDEMEALRPIMDEAAEIIQRQYHRLQAQRKLEWKRQIKIHKGNVFKMLKKMKRCISNCVTI